MRSIWQSGILHHPAPQPLDQLGSTLWGPTGRCSGPVQVWTVSELCGQGTLETAIARGWLRAGSSALGKAEAGPDLPAILATAQVGAWQGGAFFFRPVCRPAVAVLCVQTCCCRPLSHAAWPRLTATRPLPCPLGDVACRRLRPRWPTCMRTALRTAS